MAAGRPGLFQLEESRTLHYKDAEAWVKMNSEFGYGGVGAAFMERLDYVSRKLSLMDKLGPNPESTMGRLIAHEKNQLRLLEAGTDKKTLKTLDDLGRNKLADGTGPIGRAFFMVSGADRIPVNMTMARFGRMAWDWASMTKLGSAVFSQFSGIPTTAMQAKVKFGYSLFDAWEKPRGPSSAPSRRK